VRSRWNLPVCAAYALVSLVVLAYLVVQMGGQFLFQPIYRVQALFSTATDLVSGDEVTISGVPVGQVGTVTPDPQGARVELLVHQRYAPLYRDARAMIKVKNLLGETYVELNRGTAGAGPLAQGGTIPRSQTLTPVEVDEVLDVLDQSTRDQLVSLIDNLGESVDGRGQDVNAEAASLRQVAQSLQTVAGSLARQEGDLGSLLIELRKVLETLAAWHDQLRALVQNWDQVMQALAAHEQSLEDLFVHENEVMAILDQALSRNAPGLHQAVQQSPELIDSAAAYTANADVIFGRVSQHTGPIAELFQELASVMSATDEHGNHEWRVYPVSGGLGTISQPLLQGGGR